MFYWNLHHGSKYFEVIYVTASIKPRCEGLGALIEAECVLEVCKFLDARCNFPSTDIDRKIQIGKVLLHLKKIFRNVCKGNAEH